MATFIRYIYYKEVMVKAESFLSLTYMMIIDITIIIS